MASPDHRRVDRGLASNAQQNGQAAPANTTGGAAPIENGATEAKADVAKQPPKVEPGDHIAAPEPAATEVGLAERNADQGKGSSVPMPGAVTEAVAPVASPDTATEPTNSRPQPTDTANVENAEPAKDSNSARDGADGQSEGTVAPTRMDSPPHIASDVHAALLDAGRSLTNVDFKLEVGESVPNDVNLAVVPAGITVKAPELSGMFFIVVGSKVVVANPRTRLIVRVIGPNG